MPFSITPTSVVVYGRPAPVHIDVCVCCRPATLSSGPAPMRVLQNVPRGYRDRDNKHLSVNSRIVIMVQFRCAFWLNCLCWSAAAHWPTPRWAGVCHGPAIFFSADVPMCVCFRVRFSSSCDKNKRNTGAHATIFPRWAMGFAAHAQVCNNRHQPCGDSPT